MKWQDSIEERPEVMLGKPVLKDTRLTVEHVLPEMAILFAADVVAATRPAKVAG